jgi:hypothetical protein
MERTPFDVPFGRRLVEYSVVPVTVTLPPNDALPVTMRSPVIFVFDELEFTTRRPLPMFREPTTAAFPVTFNAPITLAECSILNT